MVFFAKDYWFSSPKGYFRIRVIEGEVFAESSPNHFVCLKDLWMTRPEWQKTRDKEKREVIRVKHISEYASMIEVMKGFNTIDEQDNYIKEEMRSQGYNFAR